MDVMDFYQVNEIENLEEVVKSILFDTVKRGKAQEILDNWK
ncbi:3679_t:CDS:2, partial [Diversispora eburnea]